MELLITITVATALLVGILLFLNRPLRIAANGDIAGDFPDSGFSHAAFEKLLGEFVSPAGQVDYDRWRSSDTAVAELDSYIAAVARFSPGNAPGRFADANAELAYWIHGYNAYVIKSVLDRWPITSVTDVKAPVELISGLGFFHRLRFPFGGRYLSLLAVENGIIRKRYRDPRIHFVLNCASGSCPPARPNLPTGDALDSLLEEAALEFITDTQNVSVDHAGRTISLSRIFKWYRKGFVDHARLHGMPDAINALDYIRSIAPKSLAQELAQAADYDVVYRDYDWSINAVQESLEDRPVM